jgi:glycosyltransferase involved in cell wall biosynthesis
MWTHEVICCSEYMRVFAIQQEGLREGKVKKIYHGVNLARFDISIDREKYALEIGLHPSRKTVGTVGRLIELKGHEYFLKSVPLILEKHPETQFLIVGDGYLREPLMASYLFPRFSGGHSGTAPLDGRVRISVIE